MPRREPEKVLSGYFGFSNIGDELLLSVFQKVFAGPLYIPTGWCRNPLALFVRLLRSRGSVLVFPGGEVFQDRTGLASLLFYAAQVFAARLARRKIILLFQGWPADLSPCGGFLVRRIFRAASFVSFRDRNSQPEGLKNISASYSADPCFLLRPPGISPRPGQILCVLKRPDSFAEKNRWQSLLPVLAGFFSSGELLFASFHPSDRAFAEYCCHIVRRMGHRSSVVTPAYPEVLRLTASSSFVLCGRYHAAVLALLCGRHALGLDRDGRMHSLSRFTAAFPVVSLKDILADPSLFLKALKSARRRAVPRRAGLRRGVEAVFREASFALGNSGCGAAGGQDFLESAL